MLCLLVFFSLVVTPFSSTEGLDTAALLLITFLVVVAFFVGYGFGMTGFEWGDLGLPLFQTTLPVGSGEIAFARIVAAGPAALVTTAVLVIGAATWLVFPGHWGAAKEVFSESFVGSSNLTFEALAMLGTASLLVLAWGQMVAGMVPALTGRGWVVNAVVVWYLTLVIGLGVLAQHVYFHPDSLELAVEAVTWGCWVLVSGKMAAVAWALRAVHRRGLLSPRTVAATLMAWTVGVGSLVTLSAGLLPSQVRSLAVVGVLLIPLVRVVAAPLAVNWNRHR